MTPNINITEIQLFKALKQKLGEQEAEALVTFVQSEVAAQTEARTAQQAAIITKDIAVLREHIDGRFQQIDEKLQRFATKEDVERGFKQQFWLIIVLFLPLYLTMPAFVFNIVKK
jgi:hypothetical protein